MRFSKQRMAQIAIPGIVLAGIATLIWKAQGTEYGLAGSKPGYEVVGELPDPLLRQSRLCDNVVATSDTVWTLGVLEADDPRPELGRPMDEIVDLGSIVPDSGRWQPSTMLAYGARDKVALTTLSRLEPDGSFRVMATLPVDACLKVLPESETLLLTTDLHLPDDKDDRVQSDGSPTGQGLVFRSTDKGESWQWRSAGMMLDVIPFSSQLMGLEFYNDNEVWAWGLEQDNLSGGWPRREEDGLYISNLGYSRDQGVTSTLISSDQPFNVTQEWLASQLPEGAGEFRKAPLLDQRFVVQTSDHSAYAWLSQSFNYRLKGEDGLVDVTSTVVMERADRKEAWQVTGVNRQTGLRTRHVKAGGNGEAHAILRHEGESWQLARLDPQTGEWVERQALPNLIPDWLFDTHTSVSNFWSNGRYQVVNLHESHDVASLVPGYDHDASFYTTSHFYTDDGGASWHQLAIPGERDAVLGMEARGNRLFWSKGDWFKVKEPYLWSYNLAE